MAKIGLRYFVFAPVANDNNGAVPTYEKGVVMGEAISADVSWTRSDVKLYADDKVAEVDNSITGGTITMGVNDLTDEVQAAMLNSRADETDSGAYIESGVSGPNGGVGYVRVMRLHGVDKFIAYWIYKTSFVPGDENAATKGETVDWQTPTVVGEVMGVDGGGDMPDFRARKTFDTFEAAKGWINTKAGITA